MPLFLLSPPPLLPMQSISLMLIAKTKKPQIILSLIVTLLLQHWEIGKWIEWTGWTTLLLSSTIPTLRNDSLDEQEKEENGNDDDLGEEVQNNVSSTIFNDNVMGDDDGEGHIFFQNAHDGEVDEDDNSSTSEEVQNVDNVRGDDRGGDTILYDAHDGEEDEDDTSVSSSKSIYKDLCIRLTFALEKRKRSDRDTRNENKRLRGEIRQLRGA